MQPLTINPLFRQLSGNFLQRLQSVVQVYERLVYIVGYGSQSAALYLGPMCCLANWKDRLDDNLNFVEEPSNYWVEM